MGNARIKGIVCPLGISFLSQSQSILIPKPEVTLSQLAEWLRCLPTRGRENHIGYLRRHLCEVRYLNNAPLSISVPLGEIPKDNIDCRFPDEDVVALGEARHRDLSVLSPLIVLGDSNTWTIGDFLRDFYVLNNLGKRHTVMKDTLNGQIEHQERPNGHQSYLDSCSIGNQQLWES